MNQDLFPELNLTVLQSFGRIWAQRFSPSRITLHRASSPYRYALVFHGASTDGEAFLNGLSHLMNQYDEELLTPDFINVYREERDWHFRDDWTTVTVRARSSVPLEIEIFETLGIDPEHWLLYPCPEEQVKAADGVPDEFQGDGLYPTTVNGREAWILILGGGRAEGVFARRGFRYIKTLMENPEKEFESDELAIASGEPLQAVTRETVGNMDNVRVDQRTGEARIILSSSPDDGMSGKTKKKKGPRILRPFRSRSLELIVTEINVCKEDLREAEENNDTGRIEALNEKIERLMEEAHAGQEADPPDTGEKNTQRNYKRLSKSIRDAIASVKMQHPEMHLILKDCIHFRFQRISFTPPKR